MAINDTNVPEFIQACDGAMFERKLGRIISTVAAACVDEESSGEVTIKLKFKQVGTSQVSCSHTISSKRPTQRGSASAIDTTSTVFNVHHGGVTLGTVDQLDMLEDEKPQRNPNQEIEELS